MTRKPTHANSAKPLEDLPRSFVTATGLSADYADMTTESDREAEAEQWLGALSLGTALDEA
jgi:hypothetical protein